jgi:hypothetical protein
MSNFSEKSWTFLSAPGGSGSFYAGGFYHDSGSNNNFNPAINFGSADSSYAAHFYIVTSALTAGGFSLAVTVDGVDGMSINDNGVAGTQGEFITVPAGTAADSYFETSTKYCGQISIEIASGTPPACNYGWAKYWDNNNTNFTVVGFEATWRAGATDTGADIILRHHKTTGWTYGAGGPTLPTAICSLLADHTEVGRKLVSGEPGAYKRSNLNTNIAGGGSEGTIIEIQTGAPGAFEIGTALMRTKAAGDLGRL